jgi:hypothetical protein
MFRVFSQIIEEFHLSKVQISLFFHLYNFHTPYYLNIVDDGKIQSDESARAGVGDRMSATNSMYEKGLKDEIEKGEEQKEDKKPEKMVCSIFP